MRFANRAMSVGGLLFAVTGLAACGSGGSLLSAYQAHELKGQLSQVAQSLSTKQCQQAANQITNFRSTVDGLGSVDQALVANLDQGASRLSQLAAKECPVQTVHHRTTTQTTTTQTVPSTTTTTQTATTPTTTTTQTTTTPTTPTQTTTTTTTTTTPAGSGSGGAGLSGAGQGSNSQAKAPAAGGSAS